MMSHITLRASSAPHSEGGAEAEFALDENPPLAFSTVLFSLALLDAMICAFALLSPYPVLQERRGDKSKSQR